MALSLSDRSHVTVDGLPVAVAELRRLFDVEACRAPDGRPPEHSLLDGEEEEAQEEKRRGTSRGATCGQRVWTPH